MKWFKLLKLAKKLLFINSFQWGYHVDQISHLKITLKKGLGYLDAPILNFRAGATF